MAKSDRVANNIEHLPVKTAPLMAVSFPGYHSAVCIKLPLA